MLSKYSLFALALGTGSANSAMAADCPQLPQSLQLSNITTIPDPFSWYPSSQPGRVSTLEDWQCRSQQISTLLQELELGTKPPAPSTVTSKFSQDVLTITASDGNNSVSFDASVAYPANTTGPYPAVIAYGGLSIPLPGGVATITFDNSQIAEQNDQSSRGVGLFYDLYGADHSAGAMIAWAWATSLIIDVLEISPELQIDTERLGVTGCSRNGKGALVAGAFDSRIALTIPQESGTGGSGCWRLDDAEDGAPTLVQTAGEIVQENVWFSTAFDTYANNVTLLPFDHHMLAGLVAPRALLSIDNVGYQWLGPWSSMGCMESARLIWTAFGVPDHMGYSMSSNHLHCSFPDEQQDDLFAFINRFLLNENVNTTVESNYGNVSFPLQDWVNWEVPVFS